MLSKDAALCPNLNWVPRVFGAKCLTSKPFFLRRYGQERLEKACARANAFGDPTYRTVKTILERGLDKEYPKAAWKLP